MITKYYRLGEAIETRDFKRFVESNYQFHFQIHRLSHSAVFVKVIESIRPQFAPYMRLVYEQYGSADLVDQHERAARPLIRKNRTP